MLAFQCVERSTDDGSPNVRSPYAESLQGAWRRLRTVGYSEGVATTMLHSRRASSTRVYSTHIRRWNAFCLDRRINTTITTVPLVLNFLQTLVDSGLSYASINTAKSAVSTVVILPDNIQLGTHVDVKVFMRGVYNLRPPIPRRTEIWDPDTVLELLNSRSGPTGGPTGLPTEFLVKFLCTLVLLTTGQRPQVLVALRLDDLHIDKHKAVFTLSSQDVKQGRPGYQAPIVSLRDYPSNPKLCVFKYLLEYLRRTKTSRGQINQLLITLKKPYHPISLNTAARWVKDTLRMAGIDTDRYAAGSTRLAATSKARLQGAPITLIMDSAGWTRRSTFARFYDRQVVKDKDIGDFILPKS